MRWEISWWQFTMMVVSGTVSLLVTYAPTLTGVLPPSRDVWLAALLGSLPSLILMFTVYGLTLRFPNTPVFDYTTVIFGSFLGKLVNFYLATFFLIWAAVAVKQSAFFFAAAVYLRTPVTVFLIGFLILAFVATREGIEFIARVSELAGVLVILGLVILMIGSLPMTDWGRVLPVLGEGFDPVWKQALTPIGVLGQASWIALLTFPHLANIRQAPRGIWVAFLLTTFFAAFGSTQLLGVLGEEVTAFLAFPSASAARAISIANVFERVEWLVIIMWMGAMGVKVSLLTLGAAQGFKGTFPSLAYSKITLGVLVAVLVITQFWQTHLTDVLNFFGARNYLRYALPLQWAPFVFLGVALVRGSRLVARSADNKRAEPAKFHRHAEDAP